MEKDAKSKKKKKKEEEARKKRRATFWTLGVVAPILAGLVLFLPPLLIERFGPQVNATAQVSTATSCNFVMPLEGDLEDDPTQLAVPPSGMGTMPCDDAISKLNGVHNHLVVDAVITSANEEAVVLTDVSIEVEEQTPISGSAYYSTGGIGGDATTLRVIANVEATDPVQEVEVHRQDGPPDTYGSLRELPSRQFATKSDPLVVELTFSGNKAYTTFDIILHWQKGSFSDTTRLDNNGAGFQVAGTEDLPSFTRGGDDVWVPGSD